MELRQTETEILEKAIEAFRRTTGIRVRSAAIEAQARLASSGCKIAL